MHRLIDEAARTGRAMTLAVVKTNPALKGRVQVVASHELEAA